MRSLIAALAFVSLAACSQPAPPEPAAPAEQQIAVNAPSGEYALDTNHSTVTVRAQHFGLAWYSLRFNRVSGTLNFDADNPTQSSVTFTVDTTSLDTPYAGDRDFDAELQNSEWLSAVEHPTATFSSTSVELTGANSARVTGDLTLRGVTRPATFDVTYNGSWRQHPAGPAISGIGFSAHGIIRRSEFGMSVLQPSAGPQSGVSDEVQLVVEAEFNRPLEDAPAPEPSTSEPVN